MALPYAILGFLNYGPLSGYDLKKVFDVSVRHFWPADQSQIYRALNDLTERGLVRMKVVEQTERPDRKVYHITRAGRAALLEWLGGSTPERASRSTSLMQVFFFGQLPDDAISRRFGTYAEAVRRSLADFDKLSGELLRSLPETCTPREHFFWMLTLDLGIRTARARLEWAEAALGKLKSGKVPKG